MLMVISISQKMIFYQLILLLQVLSILSLLELFLYQELMLLHSTSQLKDYHLEHLLTLDLIIMILLQFISVMSSLVLLGLLKALMILEQKKISISHSLVEPLILETISLFLEKMEHLLVMVQMIKVKYLKLRL